jgi:hypothetical protein
VKYADGTEVFEGDEVLMGQRSMARVCLHHSSQRAARGTGRVALSIWIILRPLWFRYRTADMAAASPSGAG